MSDKKKMSPDQMRNKLSHLKKKFVRGQLEEAYDKETLAKIKESMEKAQDAINQRKAEELAKDKFKIKGTDKIDTQVPIAKVHGVTDKIDTRGIQKIGKTQDILDKVAKHRALKQVAKTGGKKLLGAIPFVGGLASAMSTGDVYAAMPIEAEALGEGSDRIPGAHHEERRMANKLAKNPEAAEMFGLRDRQEYVTDPTLEKQKPLSPQELAGEESDQDKIARIKALRTLRNRYS